MLSDGRRSAMSTPVLCRGQMGDVLTAVCSAPFEGSYDVYDTVRTPQDVTDSHGILMAGDSFQL